MIYQPRESKHWITPDQLEHFIIGRLGAMLLALSIALVKRPIERAEPVVDCAGLVKEVKDAHAALDQHNVPKRDRTTVPWSLPARIHLLSQKQRAPLRRQPAATGSR